MSRNLNVAVAGATGLVGESIVELLEERNFPIGELFLLASEETAGQPVSFGKRSIRVQPLDDFDFSQVELAFFAVPAEVAVSYAERATEQGAVVIDSSAAFRLEQDVPLVVAGINNEQLDGFRARNLVASPGALSQQLGRIYHVANQLAGIGQVSVSSYQSASMAGRAGVEALATQTAALLNAKEVTPAVFPQQMAFNMLPQAGELLDNGYFTDELRCVAELRKITGEDLLPVNATAVQVPAFHGCGLSVTLNMHQSVSAAEFLAVAASMASLVVQDESDRQDIASPVTHAVGQDQQFLSRIRQDLEQSGVLNLWSVVDNVRFTGAFNSVQIGEMLIKDYL